LSKIFFNESSDPVHKTCPKLKLNLFELELMAKMADTAAVLE